MDKKTLKKKNTSRPQRPVKLTVHEMNLVSPDRNAKDIGKLKEAIVRAESVTIPNRTQLYDLYHDITTLDGHLGGLIEKRINAAKNKLPGLRYVNAKKQKVDAFDILISSDKFSKLVELIIESRLWGISGVEFIVGKEFDFEQIPRKHIRPEQGVITLSQYDSQGTPVADLPFVWVIGEPNNLGKLLQCAMYALYKRSGFGDFAQFVEIFGQPVRIVYYDAYDTQTKDQLRKLLHESGSSLTMMIPKQAQFQMLDGKTSNSNGDLQLSLIRACREEMSVAILGNTETTTSSSSSGYAQAKEQGRQQLEITRDDIIFVQNTLNSEKFIRILQSCGYPVVEGGKFEFELELDVDMLTKRLAIDREVSAHVPYNDDYWYFTYGVPKPENYEQLKAERDEQRRAAAAPPAAGGDDDDNKSDGNDIKISKRGKNLLAQMKDFFFGATELISLDEYYSAGCCACEQQPHNLADDGEWDNIYESIAAQLLSSKLENGHIPHELYEKTAAQLMNAINSGLGGSSFNYSDSRNILKSYLTRNIYHFSAAKSLTEMLEFRNLMYDKKTGEVRNFTDFRQALSARGKRFNQAYLKTEYDTALQSAIMAHKWDTLTSEYLEFSTVGDKRVRPKHAILDGKTFPKDDPFWDRYYPPLDWNCRCTVVPGVAQKHNPDKSFTKSVPLKPLFSHNVGNTRVIFRDSHPYFVNSASEIKDLTWKHYGLREVELIRRNPLNLPQMEIVADKQAYLDWWAKQPKVKGDDIAVKDVLGQNVLFESHEGKSSNPFKYFKYHVLKKGNEHREQYAVNFRDILEKPHEVWDYADKKMSGGNKTFYIKYYRTNTIVVVVDNKTLTAETIYSLNSNERINQLRKGLLKHKSNR